MKKLFLLDAYALIYRAYYALIRSPRMTSKGFNTSAIFGFCNTLEEVLRKEKPTHIAVCFDPKGGKTFRHDLYPEYKAQRDAQPEDITLSIPYIKDIIKAYNIPVIEVEGYEADDVIGTLSRRAQDEGFITYMMTPDKDYGQLVTDKVFMYRPSLRGKDFEVRGVEQVCERYGIKRPGQVIDLLALEGDASDNIPGCPGVGEKTASKLIQEWDNVDNLIANVESLKGALKKKIEENAEQILFSRLLVTIKTDVPVEIGLDALKVEPENTERLREIYTELEFKTFLSRLNKNGASDAASPPPVADVPVQGSLFDFDGTEPAVAATECVFSGINTVTVTDGDETDRIVGRAIEKGTVGFASYSVGEDAMTARMLGFALSYDEPGVAGDTPRAYYFPMPQGNSAHCDALLARLFSADICIVSHDVKRDYVLLKNRGIDFRARYFDTSVAHYLLQPEMRHRLSDIATACLSYNMSEDEGARRKPYTELPPQLASAATGEQAAIVLAVKQPLTERLASGNLKRLFDDIELPFVRVLAEMELAGVRIDVGELAALSTQLTKRVRGLEERCYKLAGRRFNIGSPRQVGDVLFDELKIDPSAKRTKSGSYSTSEEVLEKYRNEEIVRLILDIRGLNKLLATYINSLPALINPRTGKIHTTFNQTVTATGRISSTNPNLQNIPVRTDDGREIRRAFIPDDGNLMLSADYSQIELRLMADLSGDPDMVEAFRSGADIHRATAAKIYKEPIETVTDTQRRNAKTANFGIIYGISAFGLASRLDIPRSEAKMLIDGYFDSYPHIREYIEQAKESARRDGYVSTVMGRKRFLPDINSRNAVVRSYAERNAVNAPLQGSAADIIKIAMIRIFDEMERRQMKSRMIMQVHDELVFDVVPDELPDLQQLVTREMENAYSGRVRLEVASGVGRNWLEAH